MARFRGLLAAGAVTAALTVGVTARAGQTQRQMHQEAARSYKRSDAELNRAYVRLYRALEGEPRARLKAAELAWLRFRDLEGEFRASQFKGGTIQPMARLGYLEELTRTRTDELKDAYKQFVSD